MNREPFYDKVTATLFKGSLPAWQREPLDRLLTEGLRRVRKIEDVAYVMATAYHETARFKYDGEIGEGGSRDYGEPLLLIRGKSVAYYGRGMVQLTWLQNYAKMSAFLSVEHGKPIDLVSNPDLAKDPAYSSLIIWEGMIRGMFTGKNLADYINDDGADYVGARKIVNGTDKDQLIAGYADKFEAALRLLDDTKKESGSCPLHNQKCPLIAA